MESVRGALEEATLAADGLRPAATAFSWPKRWCAIGRRRIVSTTMARKLRIWLRYTLLQLPYSGSGSKFCSRFDHGPLESGPIRSSSRIHRRPGFLRGQATNEREEVIDRLASHIRADIRHGGRVSEGIQGSSSHSSSVRSFSFSFAESGRDGQRRTEGKSRVCGESNPQRSCRKQQVGPPQLDILEGPVPETRLLT